LLAGCRLFPDTAGANQAIPGLLYAYSENRGVCSRGSRGRPVSGSGQIHGRLCRYLQNVDCRHPRDQPPGQSEAILRGHRHARVRQIPTAGDSIRIAFRNGWQRSHFRGRIVTTPTLQTSPSGTWA
jgi:hypothetical protein